MLVLSGGKRDLEAITIAARPTFAAPVPRRAHGQRPSVPKPRQGGRQRLVERAQRGRASAAELHRWRQLPATFLGPAVTQANRSCRSMGLSGQHVRPKGGRVHRQRPAPSCAPGAPEERAWWSMASATATCDSSTSTKTSGSRHPPTSSIFSNLSTLTPIYTVVSVDTSGCGSQCAVLALVKNLAA